MQITLVEEKGAHAVEVKDGETVLNMLQEQGVNFQAPCGGKGICGKCRVLVKDKSGLEYKRACQTKVEEGMEVILEKERVMTVREYGISADFPIDANKPETYGVAIDIGTTTVVCHLHDLQSGKRLATVSMANPQIVFGADVISRIVASSEGKLSEMHEVLVAGIDTMIGDLCKKAKIDRSHVVKIALAGNTVMEHIAASLPPDTIGQAPFTTLSLFGGDAELSDKFPSTYFCPCVAGYVGGDITAGVLSSSVYKKDNPYLFIDIGTNGEMVLGDKDRMVCCATAAGPAFEGTNIKYGMPATFGAISEFLYEDGEVKYQTIGGHDPVGICGSGLIDTLATMLRMGLVDYTGRLVDPDDAPENMKKYLGVEDGDDVFYLTENHEVYLTQKDVRNLQLAKAAVCGGVRTLMHDYPITLDGIEGLYLAGGFGSYIRLESAARIGLFPKELLGRASAVGNSAGEGASAVLLSSVARSDVADIASECEYIELSTSPDFTGFYVEEMEFEEEEEN